MRKKQMRRYVGRGKRAIGEPVPNGVYAAAVFSAARVLLVFWPDAVSCTYSLFRQRHLSVFGWGVGGGGKQAQGIKTTTTLGLEKNKRADTHPSNPSYGTWLCATSKGPINPRVHSTACPF